MMEDIRIAKTAERKYYKLLDKKDETDLVKLLLETQFVEGENLDSIEFSNMVARFSTIPIMEECEVIVTKQEDVFFEIRPLQLIFGRDASRDSATFIILLRYGIEWQIWYRAYRRASYRRSISDCAALLTAGVFAHYILNNQTGYKAPVPAMDLFLKTSFQAADHQADFPKLHRFFAVTEITEYEDAMPPEKLNAIRTLARPTEYILMQGGDSRLEIAPDTLLNKYGCRPFPRASAYSFSSSTATSVSNQAFNHAERIRQILIRNSAKMEDQQVVQYAIRHLRKKLGLTLGIPSRNNLLLTPSGTDASLILAGIANAYFNQQDVTHILVCADETGSGVPLALEGKHFAEITHSGVPVKKGEILAGFARHQVVPISSKDEHGEIKSLIAIENEIEQALEEAIANGANIVLHGMDQSKLGLKAPGPVFLEKVRKKAGTDRLIICIDASQLRMGKAAIKQYVDSGCLLLFTGSKFFTAPPFCGALYLPENVLKQFGGKISLPAGLKDYTYETDWPQQLKVEPAPVEGYNLGMGLRWECAWFEMERYFLVPEVLRKTGIARFCNSVEAMADALPYIERLTINKPLIPTETSTEWEEEFGSYATIIPFFILKDGHPLTEAETERVYRLLNMNLAGSAESEDFINRRLASRECHIGQPVSARYHGKHPSAVVRISLGSRVISESWREQDVSLFLKNINLQISQVEIIFRKIKWILEGLRTVG